MGHQGHWKKKLGFPFLALVSSPLCPPPAAGGAVSRACAGRAAQRTRAPPGSSSGGAWPSARVETTAYQA